MWTGASSVRSSSRSSSDSSLAAISTRVRARRGRVLLRHARADAREPTARRRSYRRARARDHPARRPVARRHDARGPRRTRAHDGQLDPERQPQLGHWDALLPSTTPASQAGILHGNNDGIPNFRWWEKETGQLLVANHPEDATEIERRISNGEGLLSPGGASISNIFTGDGDRAFLVMSTIKVKERGLGQSAGVRAGSSSAPTTTSR